VAASLEIVKNHSKVEQESTITDYLNVNGEFSEAKTNGGQINESIKSSQRAKDKL